MGTDAATAGSSGTPSEAGTSLTAGNAGAGASGGVPSTAGTTGAVSGGGAQATGGAGGAGGSVFSSGGAGSSSGGSDPGGTGAGSTQLGGAPGAGGDAGSSAGAGGEGCSPNECVPNVFAIDKYVLGSGSGFSASAIVTWSATGLVVDFTVVDSTPRNDSPEPWNDDAVEVFLDLNDGRTSSYESDDFQLIVPRDESATYSPQASADTGSMPVERSSNASGYRVKLTVPWSSLGVGADPPLGKTIGFDLAADDDSDGGDRNSQIVTFGTVDNYRSTSSFGELQLN